MVVLSLAIGLAEQDDFANLPDLQEVPPSQETPPDKRYLSECVRMCVRACVERCIICLTNPQQAVEHLPESTALWVIPSIACICHRLRGSRYRHSGALRSCILSLSSHNEIQSFLSSSVPKR